MPECSTCGKEFDTQAALNNHSQVHRDDSSGAELSLSMRQYGVIAAVLLAAAVGYAVIGGDDGGAVNDGDVRQQVSVDDDPMLGDADAPVTVVYWGDYKCPNCKRFEQRAFSRLENGPISDGEVRFVKKNFPFIAADSTTAAVASQCIWRQAGAAYPDVFWKWHEAMYSNQRAEHQRWASQDRIVSIAKDVGQIDTAGLRECMTGDRAAIEQEIQEDQDEGRAVGVTGTPSFVVYNTETGEWVTVAGPQPYSRFAAAIDQVA